MASPQERFTNSSQSLSFGSSSAVEVLAIVTKAEAARWLAAHGTPGAPSSSR
jgi:hypothetical protein